MVFSSCRGSVENPNKELSLEAFSDFRTKEYALNSHQIRRNIDRLMSSDGIQLPMDRQTRRYYAEKNPFMWITRNGVNDRADSVLVFLKKADYYGLNVKMFRAEQIEEDIERIRNLDVPVAGDDINAVMARLEYNLTRAYFRYSAGQNFGFVNPDYLYNNLEKYAVDSVTEKFRQLCDLKVKRPDDTFYALAVKKAFTDSVSDFLSSTHPEGKLYELLLNRLNTAGLSSKSRRITICNIERCRWRFRGISNPDSYNKYVVVNIPSYTLRAVSEDSILTMRTGCGTTEFKTPLLSSHITRMDVNPQWIVPKSIAKGFASNYSYMHRMGMFVYDKKKGKLPPEEAIYSKVMAGEQYIIQAGGPKNSLGRIIFRFDNNFSVYLHDTSSPWVFQRNNRAVSHGCVRVAKPFDLALFLLGDKAESFKEKLEYSMTVEFVNDNDSVVKQKIDRKKLVNTLSVKPSVPLFITYYTVFYNDFGSLSEFEDVYGYDEVLMDKLSPFIN